MTNDKRNQARQAAEFIQANGSDNATPAMRTAAHQVRVQVNMDVEKTAREIAARLRPMIGGIIDRLKDKAGEGIAQAKGKAAGPNDADDLAGKYPYADPGQ